METKNFSSSLRVLVTVLVRGVVGSNLGVIMDRMGVGAGLSTFLLALELLAVAVVQPKAAAVKVEEAKGVSLIHEGAALLRVDLRTAVDVAGPWEAKMLLFLLFLLVAFFLLPVVPLTAVVTSSLMELLTDTAT